jgi:hypothetical protein
VSGWRGWWQERDDDRALRPRPDADAVQRAPVAPETAAGNAALAGLVRDGGVPLSVAAQAGNAALAGLVRDVQVRRRGLGGQGAGPLDGELAAAIDAERGGGAPLPDPVRTDMEQQLGADLGVVRVHTGPAADTLNQALTADAFTVGTDVFFSNGRFDPTGSAGRELLAHELTHVVQQSAGPGTADSRVSHPDDAAEVQAEAVARQVGQGAAATPAGPLRPVAAGAAVHRHNSYEHQLLGDTRPADVAHAKVLDPDVNDAWRHLVEDEYARVTFFTAGAERDPRNDFPQTRWIQLGASRLWASSGELSAFGDYLPNPDAIDSLPATTLIPILQRMRQEIARAIHDKLTGGTEGMTSEDAAAAVRERNRQTRFAGAVGNDNAHLLPESAQSIQDLDSASSSLGPNRQKGLLARNACHFAPFSWERWALYHNEARALAAEAHRTGHTESPLSMRRNPDGMSDAERKAWVNNGYSNHFLQDSFAAGHLINKTLVMQWFVAYNSKLGFADRPHFGVPDEANGMTPAKQPDLADRRAYDHTRLDVTATQDHSAGAVVTDPQTTLERTTGEGRLAGSGLRSTDPEPAKEYAQYAEFLDSAYLNLAANDIHDYFNERGLKVANRAGNEFVVGGDGTLLLEDESAIEVTLRADSLADQAVHDLITTGTTAIGVDDIFRLFPSTVVVEGKPYPLQDWNDEIMRQICETEIFPKMADNWSYKGVRAFGRKLVDAPGQPGGGVLTPDR